MAIFVKNTSTENINRNKRALLEKFWLIFAVFSRIYSVNEKVHVLTSRRFKHFLWYLILKDRYKNIFSQVVVFGVEIVFKMLKMSIRTFSQTYGD